MVKYTHVRRLPELTRHYINDAGKKLVKKEVEKKLNNILLYPVHYLTTEIR